MANYHFTTQSISRRSGKNCTASLAYRSASRLCDQQTGETFDYTNKPFVDHVEILFPENAPQWIRDIAQECKVSRQSALQKFSDIIEAAEKRKDARVYREIEFSLPNELTLQQNKEWATAFVQDTCVKLGMVAIANFHNDIDEETGEAKPHCHVLLATRPLIETGFSRTKERDWNKVALLHDWREQYAQYQNAALKAHGHDVRVDHRSFKDQGLFELTPQPKRGKAVSQMAAKGTETDKQNTFDLVRLKNQFQIIKNPDLVFKIVTSHHSTFTAHDIAKILNRYIDQADQYQTLYHRLLGSPELVSLENTKGEPVYTTREMLRLEMNLVKTAESLAAQKTHAVDPKIIEDVIAAQNRELAKHGGLSPDQDTAIRHMLSGERISCVVGFAGAGKTTCLIAARHGWEKAGYKVLGLAPTGRAAENMAQTGLRSMTLHKFLQEQAAGREHISNKTVLVIDEAGMVDSRRFNEIMTLVDKAGAKPVPMGDGNQLQAVEAGPAFRLLTNRVKPAVLETVVRQKEDWQKTATQHFGKLEPRKALELYQEKGAFKTIQERDINPKNAVDTYCLARKISGRIWKEMAGDEPKVDFERIKQHQDFEVYNTWKTMRVSALNDIIQNFETHKERLSELGVDVQSLGDIVAKGKAPSVMKDIEATLRKMSYDVPIDTRLETKAALVGAWARDRATQPDQTHLMLAFTNRDVVSLNESARTLMRTAGKITGQDFTVITHQVTKDDFEVETIHAQEKAFAQGDRLLFTRNENGLKVKNGSLGTIVALTKNKISVVLDEGDKQLSFAPKLYPFIDQGWATTIHKAQGVTVDHIKKLASFEEYRNLAYVSMSRHRQTLEVYGSNLDFWRPEKFIDRLSHVQEKLSGADYLNPEAILKQLKSDETILWHEKKLQQGKDFWAAIKGTAHTVVGQLLDRPKEDKGIESEYRSFDTSEETRSRDLFTFRESLPVERAQFEERHANKFQEACEFFEFRDRYGHAPTVEDKPLIAVMGEQLSRLAGRLFQEKALECGKLPDVSDITKQAYQEFAQRPVVEQALANRLAADHQVSAETARLMATLVLNQQDITSDKLSAVSESSVLELAKYGVQRSGEIGAESGNSVEKGVGSEQNKSLTNFRLAKELDQIQAHTLRHGTLPTGDSLKQIQETARIESEKMVVKMTQERVSQMQRENTMREGMRM